ncbi:MAG TPA: DUF2795 domain-containing protein [Patescibacteria group bacterium]|nr:DUF2795 domain-containing protein [Patescibacteria group bacterium]
MANVSNDQVKKCLSGISYPADKSKLIQYAESTCGDEKVISMLKQLPEKSYGEPQMLTSELRSVLPGINIDIL